MIRAARFALLCLLGLAAVAGCGGGGGSSSGGPDPATTVPPARGSTSRACCGRRGTSRRTHGLDLHRDIFGLIGDIAVFARGSTKEDLDGGLIIAVTDDDRATTVFGKLVGLLRTQGEVDPRPVRVPGAEQAFSVAIPDATKPIVLARGPGKFVVAYGRDAAAAAFQPQTRLADTALYKQAKASLDGDFDPAFLVSVDGFLKIVDAFGKGTDAGFEKFRPYLERFSVIAGGGKASDKRSDAALGAGLK